MRKIKIEEFGILNHETIIELKQNEYVFFKANENNNIVGLHTDGLATCSSIIISFNSDEFIFFSHIDEKSDLINAIKEDILNELSTNIKKIDINYSKGNNCLKNDILDYDCIISDLANLLKENLPNNDNIVIDKKVKRHDSIMGCLKIFKSSNLENIKNEEIQMIKINMNKKGCKKILKKFYEQSIDFYEKNIDYQHNIIYHFSRERFIEVLDKLNIFIVSDNF